MEWGCVKWRYNKYVPGKGQIIRRARIMKKMLAMLLGAAVVLSSTACGSAEKTEPPTTVAKDAKSDAQSAQPAQEQEKAAEVDGYILRLGTDAV